MSAILWALIAMLAYSFVAPLVGRAIGGGMPEFLVLLITSVMLVTASFVLAVLTGEFSWRNLAHPAAWNAYLGGAFLAVGIASYYRALSLGSVSVVVPIFGLFIVVSSVLGFLLGEPVTLRKALGIVLAGIAVYLVAGS